MDDIVLPRAHPRQHQKHTSNSHKPKEHPRHKKTGSSSSTASRSTAKTSPTEPHHRHHSKPKQTHPPAKHQKHTKSHKPTHSPTSAHTTSHSSTKPTNSHSSSKTQHTSTSPFGVPSRSSTSISKSSSSTVAGESTGTPVAAQTSHNTVSSGLSTAQIAAAAVVPIVVIVAALFAFFYFRRRKNRVHPRDTTHQSQSDSSLPVEQVPYYSKVNQSTKPQASQTMSHTGAQITETTLLSAAAIGTQRSSGSDEQRMKDAPPPPYISPTKIGVAPRIDSSTLHPVSPMFSGFDHDPFGDPSPRGSPSFSQGLPTESPMPIPNSAITANYSTQSEMRTSNRTSSPTLGLEAGRVMIRERDDDEISAVSEEEDVEYGEAEMGQAGMARRERASVIDMTVMSTSPPRDGQL